MVWKGLLPMAATAVKETVQNVDKAKMLFALGVCGVVGTGIASAKAAPVAKAKMADIQDTADKIEWVDSGEARKYKALRYVKEVAPLWAPALLAGGTAIVAFGMSNKQLAVKAAAASTAAGIAERMLESYSEKAIEVVGEETEAKIRQAMADDIPDEVLEKTRGYLTENDVANLWPHTAHQELWYDHVTSRLFWATEAELYSAESEVNQKINNETFATIADFYNFLLLDTGKLEEANGWDHNDSYVNTLDLRFGSRLDPNTGLVMKAIDYRTIQLFPNETKQLRTMN